MDLAFWEEVLQWLVLGILLGRVFGRKGSAGSAAPRDTIKPRDWGNPL